MKKITIVAEFVIDDDAFEQEEDILAWANLVIGDEIEEEAGGKITHIGVMMREVEKYNG